MSKVILFSGQNLDIYSASTETALELPLVPFGISAGFPSPALDFVDFLHTKRLRIIFRKELII